MNENSLDGANLPIYWKDMFVPEDVVDDGGNVVDNQNLSAKYPNMKYSMNNEASNFWQISSFRMYLRNVSLGYTLPKDLTAKVGIQKARIYVNGANLFTIDNYKIADPEAGVTRNDNNEVINSNGVLSYPLQRTITFGANITF